MLGDQRAFLDGAPDDEIDIDADVAAMGLVHEPFDHLPALLIAVLAGQAGIDRVQPHVAVAVSGLPLVLNRGQPDGVDAHFLIVIEHPDGRLEGALLRGAFHTQLGQNQRFHPIGVPALHVHLIVGQIAGGKCAVIDDFHVRSSCMVSSPSCVQAG